MARCEGPEFKSTCYLSLFSFFTETVQSSCSVQLQYIEIGTRVRTDTSLVSYRLSYHRATSLTPVH